MLLADFSTLPGFEAIGEVTHYGSKVFAKPGNPSVRLTVIMANRLPLELRVPVDGDHGFRWNVIKVSGAA
jgi:hypothetical protein